MLMHILYYAVEALVLAVLYWLGVAAGVKALVVYGADVHFRSGQTFLLLWFFLVIIGMVLGETRGPECLAPFHVGLVVLATGVAFRLYSVIFRPCARVQ